MQYCNIVNTYNNVWRINFVSSSIFFTFLHIICHFHKLTLTISLLISFKHSFRFSVFNPVRVSPPASLIYPLLSSFKMFAYTKIIYNLLKQKIMQNKCLYLKLTASLPHIVLCIHTVSRPRVWWHANYRFSLLVLFLFLLNFIAFYKRQFKCKTKIVTHEHSFYWMV